MPRLPADPVGRLAILEGARAGVQPGTILNAGEMAEVAGMTWRNLAMIVEADKDFPIVQRGDMGVPWQFDAAAALDHMIGSARSARDVRDARRAEVERLSGLGGASAVASSGGEQAGSGSAAERWTEARAIGALIDAQAKLRAERQKRGLLVDRQKVETLLAAVMSTMQTETLAVSSRMDPAGSWEPGFRAQVDEELRNVLVSVRDRLEKEIEAWGAAVD